MRHRHYRRFLITFLASALVVILPAWVLIFRGLYIAPINDSSELVDFQMDKLRDTPPTEVVFIGDSSLGNSIDAAEFTRLSGRRTLNLALNGAFGLEGSYEMIKWALDEQPVKKIIVMQTMDILTRERREEALIYVLHGPSGLFTTDVLETCENLGALVSVFFSGKLLIECFESLDHKRVSPLIIMADYVRQSKPISAKDAESDDLDGRVRRERVAWLRRIKELCEERGVDLMYVHGPIYEDAAAENPKLIEKINDTLRKEGIPSDYVIQTMTLPELGNSIDHVRPSEKDEFTLRYYNRLKDWLAR